MQTNLGKVLDIIGRPQFVIPGMILAAFLCFLPKTEALRFNPDIEGYKIDIPYPQEEPYWKLSGYDTEYKNAILKDFQNMLSNAGIPRKEQRWYAAQLFSENGSFDPTRFGDYVKDGKWCKKIVKGCRPLSFGLIQYNSYAKHDLYADTFLQKNPEWKTVEKQLSWMVEQIIERRNSYGSNIRRIILSHNAPSLADKGYADSTAGYVRKVERNMAHFSLNSL